jgi:hypothetical protein
VVATIHPSAILRAGDGDARQAQRRAFTEAENTTQATGSAHQRP